MYKIIAESGNDVLFQSEDESLKIVRNEDEVIDVTVPLQSLLMRGYWHEPSPETMKRDFSHLFEGAPSGVL